jgi:FkbM family methyltransferase
MSFHPKCVIPSRQRQWLRVAVGMRKHYKIPLRTLFANVGLRSIGDVLSAFEDFSVRPDGRTELNVRGVAHAIQLRNRTSDFAVFRQVFLEQQYNLPIVGRAEYIIDAGANIGLSSVYFLSRNKKARVVAIEPDSENFAIAQQNLASFGARCRLIHGALWSHSGTLAISRGTFRDGRHWSTKTVQDLHSGGEHVRAYSIDELIQATNFPRIDFLKMDIEGAELQVFRDGRDDFLSQIRCCAVECHNHSCVSAFKNAAEKFGLRCEDRGELTIASAVNG